MKADKEMHIQPERPGYQSFSLPDGRKIGYAEYGSDKGTPVLFFHGAPGSAYVHPDMAGTAIQRNVRLIAVERPGYGSSSPHPARTMQSWADDVAALTSHLGLSKYSIAAFSGGTPFALACAFKQPERITKIALFASLAPLAAPGVTDGLSPLSSGLYALARSNPDELRATFTGIATSPAALLGAISSSSTTWEQKVLQDHAANFEADYSRSLLGGIEGVASDYVLYAGDWGFPLDGIITETHLWSGSVDEFTPPAMTAYLASQLKNSSVLKLEGEGHFSLFMHWDEVLAKLA